MEKYMMFSDMNAQTIMYPSGKVKTRADVVKDYPILGTPMGVIGIRCGDNGVIGDMALMFYYADIYTLVDSYKNRITFTEGMTNAQKCDAITALINQPKTNE